MGDEDLAFVVRQHRYHFPDGFFARLGPKFLREYYRAFLTGSAARAAIAELDGRPAGYLVGVTDPVAHRDHVLQRHGTTLACQAMVAMVTRPSLGVCFLRTRFVLYARKLVRRRRANRQTTEPAPPGATAVLTHVAVAPEAQSYGIGSHLIRLFDAEATVAGCEQITLVTASGEDGAGPYYRRRGWASLGERITPDGLRLTTYARDVEARGVPQQVATRRTDRG